MCDPGRPTEPFWGALAPRLRPLILAAGLDGIIRDVGRSSRRGIAMWLPQTRACLVRGPSRRRRPRAGTKKPAAGPDFVNRPLIPTLATASPHIQDTLDAWRRCVHPQGLGVWAAAANSRCVRTAASAATRTTGAPRGQARARAFRLRFGASGRTRASVRHPVATHQRPAASLGFGGASSRCRSAWEIFKGTSSCSTSSRAAAGWSRGRRAGSSARRRPSR